MVFFLLKVCHGNTIISIHIISTGLCCCESCLVLKLNSLILKRFQKQHWLLEEHEGKKKWHVFHI